MRRSPPSPSTRAARTEVRPGFWLDSRLALWLARERLLVVADLHWGYAASHRARGNLLPVWGDAEIAQRLQSLIDDYQPAEMLWLGDVVHAAEGAASAEEFLRNASLPIAVLAGNHDRRWRSAGQKSSQRDCYFFHHGDTRLVPPADCLEIIGHHHPAVSWGDAAGSRLKLPAFVAGPRRIVLPAFSPWAAGTVWNHLAQPGETLWAISSTRIFPLPGRAPLS
jgi:uncharacterized protein